MTAIRIPRRSGSAFACRCGWALAFLAGANLIGCQSVKVHPRLRESGHGLECYQAVAIQCRGYDNETLRSELEAACKKLGYAVTSESPDLLLRIFIRKNEKEQDGSQILMVWLVGWNFGAGDGCIEADAKLVEVSSGDILLEFSARRTGLTNYSATRKWARSFASTCRKYMRTAQSVLSAASTIACAQRESGAGAENAHEPDSNTKCDKNSTSNERWIRL